MNESPVKLQGFFIGLISLLSDSKHSCNALRVQGGRVEATLAKLSRPFAKIRFGTYIEIPGVK